MNQKNINNIESSILPIIKQLGYELIKITYSEDANGNNLNIYIDKESGICVEDCEKVSKSIDKIIDDLNPTENQKYFLNVSSWGIDKPLPRFIDFQRKTGLKVKVDYYDDSKHTTIIANIVSAENNVVTFNKKGKIIKIGYDKITKTVPVINF